MNKFLFISAINYLLAFANVPGSFSHRCALRGPIVMSALAEAIRESGVQFSFQASHS